MPKGGEEQHTCSRTCGIAYRKEVAANLGGYGLTSVSIRDCSICGQAWVWANGIGRGPYARTECPRHDDAEVEAVRDAAKTVQRTASNEIARVSRAVASYCRPWVSYSCAHCDETFEAQSPRAHCSERCGRLAYNRRRKQAQGKFKPSPAQREAVYLRDGHVCHLCRHPVYLDVPHEHPWAATLDHLVPRCISRDDRDSNLATAHRYCNTIRGDRPLPATPYPAPPMVWRAGESSGGGVPPTSCISGPGVSPALVSI